MKRILALVLSVVMLMSMLPAFSMMATAEGETNNISGLNATLY